MKTISQKKLKTLVQVLFFYTLLVILWGAWVRISHSGDGCGDSWPLCKDNLVPALAETAKKTWVEYAHRLTSGLFGIFVFILCILTIKTVPKMNNKFPLARKFAIAAVILTIIEALLGAKLVLSKLVGQDDSIYRVFVMSLHFINSALLTGTIFIWSEALKLQPGHQFIKPHHLLKVLKTFFVYAVASFVILGVLGTFAALASTLFPSFTLWDGLQKDFAQNAHFLLRVRIGHPIMGCLLGGGLALGAWHISQIFQMKALQNRCLHLSYMTLTLILVGTVTLATLSPTPLKLLHLGLVHILWAFILRLFTIPEDESHHSSHPVSQI